MKKIIFALIILSLSAGQSYSMEELTINNQKSTEHNSSSGEPIVADTPVEPVNPKEEAGWQDLPDETKLLILKYIGIQKCPAKGIKELKNIERVCHECKNLSKDSTLQKMFIDYIAQHVKNNRKQAEQSFIKIGGGGDRSSLRHFKEQGIDLEVADNLGMTALIAAAKGGQIKTTKYLINRGANIYSEDKRLLTPILHACAKKHNKRVVKKLVQAGALRAGDNAVALFAAVVTGQKERVKTLLSQGVPINVRDNGKRTPLMFAAMSGDEGLVKILLENKANVAYKDEVGMSALMIACNHGHIEVAKQLIVHKANVDAKDTEKCTALIYAAWRGNMAIVKLLLNGNADATIANKAGKTAFDYAQARGHANIAALLALRSKK